KTAHAVVARAVRRRGGALETGRADHRGASRSEALAAASADGFRPRQLRRPARAVRCAAHAGLPARTLAGTVGPLPALPERHATARRTTAPGPGQGSATHAAGDAVLARLAATPRRRRRCAGAGGIALADRGMARVAVRTGIEDGRAGVGE